jgi:hypothetical protein
MILNFIIVHSGINGEKKLPVLISRLANWRDYG